MKREIQEKETEMARKGAGLVGGTCVGLKDELGVECRCTKKASGTRRRVLALWPLLEGEEEAESGMEQVP